MPESFSTEHCLDYHRERAALTIEAISDNPYSPQEEIIVHHVPGHAPDALAILIGGEALIIGDTLLPDITPWPSQELFFDGVQRILRPTYPTAESVYGLRAYIRSLKRLDVMAKELPHLMVLPAHRLFYNNRWNPMDVGKRVRELIGHHVDRCADILKILEDGRKTAREIARKHFDERLLKGAGILMAENEIVSHCELMMASGDVTMRADGTLEATGSQDFEGMIRQL
jgi:glyoxylase-like metal-dependent hydrolase (beta-lactamase superfamily II)